MSTIAVLTSNESGANSLTDINANYAALNTDKQEKGTGVTGNIVKFGASNILGDTGQAMPTGTLVGTTDTQVLTNKTLTSPTITNKASTGTDAGAETLNNKTLGAPVIADHTNAQHTHQSASQGGSLDAASISTGTLTTARLGSGTANNTNYLRGDQSWQPLTITYSVGDGSDGNVTIASPTTLTRDMYYNNLTVTSTLTTNGYRIFVNGILNGAGTITWGIANSGANAVGATRGLGGAANPSGGIFFQNVAGGNGDGVAGGGVSGGSVTIALGVAGGAGGNGSGGGGTPGGAGGTISTPVTKFGVFGDLTLKGIDMSIAGVLSTMYRSSAGGGGGYGGINSGAGGGGGASGGLTYIYANSWAGTFTISNIGGNGGNATSTFNAGGGGGGGGVSVVVYSSKTWTGTYALTGGTAGNSTAGAGNAVAGANGVSYEISLTSLTR